jgi:hypothetical protein
MATADEAVKLVAREAPPEEGGPIPMFNDIK